MNILIVSLLFFIACNKEAEPINYGKDQCEHCRMTIMDNKFGSEIITVKGKVFKFDAAECMAGYLLENNPEGRDIEKYIVTDYSAPGEFINAVNSYFLISPGIKSPMGENLSAFGNYETALKFAADKGGEVFKWNDLLNRLKKK